MKKMNIIIMITKNLIFEVSEKNEHYYHDNLKSQA